MRAIIIAAGMGSRLEHHTAERPKCMVEVGGRTILSHQLEAMRAHGVEDLHIVRGYLADRLVVPGATYWHNPDYRRNNILHSLFCAEEALKGPLLTSYSDIVYGAPVIEQLLQSEAEMALVVDRRWGEAYEGRADHPVEQAELVEVEAGRVTKIGKWVGPERALGEFIGLAKFSAQGTERLVEAWREARARYDDEAPFQHAERFRKAYLCDLFMELIDRGERLEAVVIEGGWREIDTVEDLERVNQEGY